MYSDEMPEETVSPVDEQLEQTVVASYLVNLSSVIADSNNATLPIIKMETNRLTELAYGYISPVVVLLTIVTNTLVCIVLLQKHMRSPTNLLLVAMAISDMFTGLFPVPIFVYFYTLGNFRDYVPYDWCYAHNALTIHLPTVCHTASIWLTVALSIQRYLCVCHSLQAKTLCTIQNIVRVIVALYIAALVSQASRFFEYSYTPVELTSLVGQGTVIGCSRQLIKFFEDNIEVVYGSYWWFRVVFIHLVPCTSLVIINGLLFRTMRNAQARRDMLLRQNRRSECRRLAESNMATLMLLAVISVFLLVEFPLAILLITLIYENTFQCLVMEKEKRDVATLIINLIILLSYPVNFFIYCGMSRQFRETFVNLFSTSQYKRQTSTSAWQSMELQSKTFQTNH